MTNINTFQGDVFIHEYIKHSGDDNNLFGFSGTDTFKIATGGVDAIKVDASQNVDITGVIRHIGDENNLFGFSGTDTFKIATGGTDRLTVSSAGNVTLSNKLYIPSYIYHAGGDNNTYFGFSGNDTIVMRVGGGNRFTLNSTGFIGLSQGLTQSVTPGSYLTGSAYNGATARTFAVDATTAATASKIVARDVNGDILGRYMNMSHSASARNSDTVFYSSTDNYIRKTTAAGMLSSLGVTNSATTTATTAKVGNTIVLRESSGNILGHYFNTTPDDVSTGVTKVCVETGNDGWIRHGTAASIRTFIGATSADTINTVAMRDGSGDMFARLFRSNYANQSSISGAMAYRINNSNDSYIRFCSDAAAIRTFIGCLATSGTAATATKVQVSRDDTGDTANYLVFAPNGTAGQQNLQMDANLIYDNTSNRLRLKQVYFGDQNVYGLGGVSGSYGSVQTSGTGKGSYEGYNINGQWVFMSNGAGSCGIYNDTNNEWATKWNQNGSTNLYYNNSDKLQTTNTGAHVTGDLYADHMYIDDYLYHAGGDNNTYFGFSGNDTIVMRTAGTNRLTVSSSGNVTLSNSLYVPGYIYHAGGDNNTYFGFSGNDTIVMRTNGSDRLTINSAGRVTLLNDLLVGYNLDRTSYLGRNAMGACGHNDCCSVAHIDRNNTSDYALLQGPSGITYINAASGKNLNLRIANASKASVNATGLGVHTETLSYNCDVRGNMIATNGYYVNLNLASVRMHYFVDNLAFFGDAGLNGFIEDDSNAGQINFTGQHRTFIKDIPSSQVIDLEGLIVSADQNKYIKMDGGIECGSNAITINESLPIVSLSNVLCDKRCFGVISTSEDPETRDDKYGSFVSHFDKEMGDTRVYINSVGEGAMWVTDINGPLESGDYITTSNIVGYGQKQDSEFLANYTVAKITMDCDFNPVTQPIQQIIKEPGLKNYWVDTEYYDVTQEKYSNLTTDNRRTFIREHTDEPDEPDETVYQEVRRIVLDHTSKGYELEVREEMVNVLDEHGQIRWEDHLTETEKAYKIRYLDVSGAQTDEANAVHTAAFVGCTYHCG